MIHRKSPSLLLTILAAFLLPSIALACLWDYDTIKMERSRFPSTLELITGKFLRHSPEFYQWRIEDRLKRLESDPSNASLLDDLAVAYDKTGQHDKAIELAQKTEKTHPGRYETAANLGSFFFHAGKLKEGLPYIDGALKINPDAHFGREKYQKLLVEYVLQQSKGGPVKLPLAEVAYNFVNFLRENDSRFLDQTEINAAIKGILGMMKFGKHDAPILLEALGSLLTQPGSPTEDAKLLAARAYLKASYDVPEGPARDAYRGMAANALWLQTTGQSDHDQISLEAVEKDFQKELTEAKAWYAIVRENEQSWIKDGKNPEVEFDKLYSEDPEVSGMNLVEFRATRRQELLITIGVISGVTFVVVWACGSIIRSLLKTRPAEEKNQPSQLI